MSEEFKEKAISVIVQFGNGNADDFRSLPDADLLKRYCDVTGENADDYKNA